MKKKQNNGFTLVELLAVIVILAIILVIAVPKVMSVIEDAKKATLESTAKMIASAAEKAKVQNTVLGNDKEITCDSVAKINNLDYDICDIDFEDNKALVTIKGKGKFAGLNVCSGDKTNVEATDEECVTSSETGGCDTLYWDGNTEGLVAVYNPFEPSSYWFKISDVIPNKDNVLNGVSITYNDGDTGSDVSFTQEFLENYGVMTLDGWLFIIPSDNFVIEELIFPEAGIYFVVYDLDSDPSYLTQFTINGYTGFPHSENCGH